MRDIYGRTTSRARVTIYSLGAEPGFPDARAGAIRIVGRNERDSAPSLVGATVSDALASSGGEFQIEIKADPSLFDPLKRIVDDDWIDIELGRYAQFWHVMRGIVLDVRRGKSTNPRGATETVYKVSGKSFGYCFDLVPVWFDMFTDGTLGPAAMLRVLNPNENFWDAPDVTVQAMLAGFTRFLAGAATGGVPAAPGAFSTLLQLATGAPLGVKGRANRVLPLMPGPLGASSPPKLADNVYFFGEDFANSPKRRNTIQWEAFSADGQSVWQLAEAWSDPALCELHTELMEIVGNPAATPSIDDSHLPSFGLGTRYPGGATPSPDLGIPVGRTAMSVVFRDRPFPTFSAAGGFYGSPWFKLPLYEADWTEISDSDLGRSGLERRNAFFAAPTLLHDLVSAGFVNLNRPLWSDDDLLRHGMRRFDAQTSYLGQMDLPDFVRAYQRILRDWHALDAAFLNGSVMLGRGRPDIKKGTRFRIRGGSPSEDETYYVETTQHTWRFDAGVRTSLGLTRGWRGDDASYLNELQNATGNYETRAASGPIEVGLATVGPVIAPGEELA